MFNNKTNFSQESLRVSSELAAKIRQRWAIDYHAAEGTQRSLLAEHGPDLLQPNSDSVPPVAVASVEKRHVVDAAQVGSTVFGLETHHERRQEVAGLAQDRQVREAQLGVEEAYEFAA